MPVDASGGARRPSRAGLHWCCVEHACRRPRPIVHPPRSRPSPRPAQRPRGTPAAAAVCAAARHRVWAVRFGPSARAVPLRGTEVLARLRFTALRFRPPSSPPPVRLHANLKRQSRPSRAHRSGHWPGALLVSTCQRRHGAAHPLVDTEGVRACAIPAPRRRARPHRSLRRRPRNARFTRVRTLRLALPRGRPSVKRHRLLCAASLDPAPSRVDTMFIALATRSAAHALDRTRQGEAARHIARRTRASVRPPAASTRTLAMRGVPRPEPTPPGAILSRRDGTASRPARRATSTPERSSPPRRSEAPVALDDTPAPAFSRPVPTPARRCAHGRRGRLSHEPPGPDKESWLRRRARLSCSGTAFSHHGPVHNSVSAPCNARRERRPASRAPPTRGSRTACGAWGAAPLPGAASRSVFPSSMGSGSSRDQCMNRNAPSGTVSGSSGARRGVRRAMSAGPARAPGRNAGRPRPLAARSCASTDGARAPFLVLMSPGEVVPMAPCEDSAPDRPRRLRDARDNGDPVAHYFRRDSPPASRSNPSNRSSTSAARASSTVSGKRTSHRRIASSSELRSSGVTVAPRLRASRRIPFLTLPGHLLQRLEAVGDGFEVRLEEPAPQRVPFAACRPLDDVPRRPVSMPGMPIGAVLGASCAVGARRIVSAGGRDNAGHRLHPGLRA